MPKIVFNPAIKSLLDMSGKKSVLELKPVRVTRLSKLSLLRDLDGKSVTYSSLTDNINNPKVDNFQDSYDLLPHWERKSLQRETGFWREEELYNAALDYKPSVYNNYSYDDVPLADSIVKQELGIPRVPVSFYPNTFIKADDLQILKLMHFRNNIIPSCFNREIHVAKEVIDTYAEIALNAWRRGVATNQIIRMAEKSVINPLITDIARPDPKLFEVLIRNPNARNIYVIKNRKDEEFFDEVAVTYSNLFKHKYFDSEEVALEVLSECKNKNIYPVTSVNKDLCSVVCAIRSGNSKILSSDYWEHVDKKAPWDAKCSQLLDELKKFPPKEIGAACDGVKYLLKECDCSLDFVFNNLSAVASRFSRINKVDALTDPRINRSFYKASYYLKDNLFKEVKCAKDTSGFISSECPTEECVLQMFTKQLRIFDCLYGMKNIIDIQNTLGEDVQKGLKIIDMVFFNKVEKEYSRSENMMKLIVDSAKNFGNFSRIEQLYDKYFTEIPKADLKTVYSSLDMIIMANRGIELEALLTKIETHLPKVIKYNQKYSDLSQGLSAKNITNSIKHYELKQMCAKDNFELEDCVGLNTIVDFYHGKATVKELREVQRKLK